ncbi:MAG TPA: endonuclease domain-containing protein [Candidatus Paceibacterota bacterium]
MQRLNNLPKLRDWRRDLRKRETAQERVLWWHLKDRNLDFKFKRQHSVGGYILDFYCAEKKLVLEIDGEVHHTQEAREYDHVRNKFFTDLDYKVLRFSNAEVDTDVYKVLTRIKKSLNSI